MGLSLELEVDVLVPGVAFDLLEAFFPPQDGVLHPAEGCAGDVLRAVVDPQIARLQVSGRGTAQADVAADAFVVSPGDQRPDAARWTRRTGPASGSSCRAARRRRRR